MGQTIDTLFAHAGGTLDASARRARGVRTQRGGCDCGAVRYELELDLCASDMPPAPSELTVRARTFTLLSGEESLSGHELVSPHVHHFYCELCGVCSFSRHNVELESAAFYAVDLRCLDVPRSVWSAPTG